MLRWTSKPNRECLAEDGTHAALVLDAIWCFQSHYRAVISTGPWGAGGVSGGLEKEKATQGRTWLRQARQGEQGQREPRCFPCPVSPHVLIGAKLCHSAGRGGCQGKARVMNQDKPI